MFSRLQKIQIRYKVLGMGMGIVGIFSIFIFFYQIPAYRNGLMNRKKESVQEIVRMAASLVRAYYEREKTGELTREEAQAGAIADIQKMRYGKDYNNYIWINDYEPRMIMHPYRPDLNGKSLAETKDPRGLKLFVEMVKTVKASSSGFVEYMWQYYDNKDRIVPKISYVQDIPEWGWILGSGIYVEDVHEELGVISWISRLIVTGIILLSTLILFLATRHLLEPIQVLKKTAHLIAGGDIHHTVEIHSGDEFEELNHDFNTLLEHLRQVLTESLKISHRLSGSTEDMNNTINHFSDSTGELSAVVEEITGTVEEVSASMDLVAGAASRQNDSMHQLISTVNDLSSTIQGLGQKVKESLSESETISRSARSGEESLQQMTGSIRRVQDSSQNMVRIVNMINDISDRINLLALNAAIEAARAGDAGRGFAVVSDEISRLADETASSIKEISSMIDRNNSDIEKSISITDGSIGNIRTVITGVGKIHDLMNEIYGFVQKEVEVSQLMNHEMEDVRNQSQEIRHSTEEQKRSIGEVSHSISSINNMTQSTATASQELAEESGMISHLASKLKDQISYFKVE